MQSNNLNYSYKGSNIIVELLNIIHAVETIKKNIFRSLYYPIRQIYDCLRIYYLNIQSFMNLNIFLKAANHKSSNY